MCSVGSASSTDILRPVPFLFFPNFLFFPTAMATGRGSVQQSVHAVWVARLRKSWLAEELELDFFFIKKIESSSKAPNSAHSNDWWIPRF